MWHSYAKSFNNKRFSCVCHGKLKIVDIFPEVRQISYECLKCERFYTDYIDDND